MKDMANRNTRLFTSFIIDLVNALRETPWPGHEIERAFKELPDLPYGKEVGKHPLDTLGITFIMGWDGGFSVFAASWNWTGEIFTLNDETQVSWALNKEDTGINLPHRRMMQVGKLQRAFANFHREYTSRCTRRYTDPCRTGRHPYLSGADYFSELCIQSYLKHPQVMIELRAGELILDGRSYRTGRSWRRDIRGLLPRPTSDA